MQLMAGIHFMQVSKWLGHSTFTLTLNTYGDWIPEEEGGAGNNLPEPHPPSLLFCRSSFQGTWCRSSAAIRRGSRRNLNPQFSASSKN